ncbi:HAMP domain-containing histidine kinase [Verrucomicrobiaceae bacterium R5-34]|nr:HAMP domain-containing histidine kinase [Verrucomicrobiaceae bacterium R5-34]
MNKPWIIWSLSALCAILVFGAMGLITRHTLGLEKERAHAEARAALEERIRLSLWRMDTAAAGVLAEENNRPAWHFRDVDLRKTTRLTPLNLDVPENIKLHFEVKQGQVSSPQLNGWTQPGSQWDAQLSPVQQGVKLTQQQQNNWRTLQGLLQNDGTFQGWQAKRNHQSQLTDDNLGVISAIARRDPAKDALIEPAKPSQEVVEAVQQRKGESSAAVRSSVAYQNNYNVAEKSKRQEIVKKSVDNRAMQQKAWSGGAKMKKSSTKTAPSVQAPAAALAEAGDAEIGKKLAESQELLAGPHISSLRPIWLAGELLLVRDVQDQSGRRVQGVWLDAEALKETLLRNIRDLLPNAELEPVRKSLRVMLGEEPDPNEQDPMVMAALPWRLIPGEMAVVEPVGWTPMRKTLGVAWIGALFAALAAVILLRGVVKLSERRASFVSSVTHELRTPLTTFSLYSDMLAEGMVQDETKQREYLQTLRKESSRLTHLVENVLAYSRIERGSARARVENVRVSALIDRICERLRQRAEEACMELHCEVSPEVAAREIQVDTTAVEQILFNLVDNASKYASGKDDGKVIELRALETRQGIAFQVCDQGPGVPKSEQRKLFRAFHKSAQEAAHTKPGVGLGLALCRRLARALGGDLRIIDQEKGACFELRLRA